MRTAGLSATGLTGQRSQMPASIESATKIIWYIGSKHGGRT